MPQFTNPGDDNDVMPDTRGHKDKCKCEFCVAERTAAKLPLTQEDFDSIARVFGGGHDDDSQYDFDE